MPLRRHLIPIALAGAIALGACSDSRTDPQDVTFNAAQTSANLQTVSGVFDSEGWESFEILGDILGANPPVAPVVFSPFDLSEIAGASRFETEMKLQAIAERMYQASRSATVNFVPVISESLLGTTFVFDPSQGRYVADPTRTDAPGNGVRFILYAVNPVTQQPIVETEIGWADFTDEGAELANAIELRLQVVSNNATFLDYTVTVTETETSASIDIDGFVTNGEDTLTFDLDITIDANGLSFAAVLEVLNESIRVEASVDFTVENEIVIVDIEVVVTSGQDSLRVVASGDDTGFTAQVFVGNVLFANIQGLGEGEPSVTGADGRQLTEEEIQALVRAVELIDDIFDLFENLLEPVDGILALGVAL